MLKIQHIILSVNSPEVSSSVRPCYVEFSKVHESKQTLNQCYQRWQITTYDRAKAAPLSSPLFYVLLDVFLSSSCMIGDMCLSVCVWMCFAWEESVCFVLRFLHELFLTYWSIVEANCFICNFNASTRFRAKYQFWDKNGRFMP